MFSILKRITGVDLLQDLAEFFQAMSGMVSGFRERARRVNELLADSQSMFLVVCGPQGEPIDEAVYFHRKLVEAKLPFGGVIVNKVHYSDDAPARAGRRPRRPAGRRGPAPSGSPPTSPTTRALAERDRRNVEHLANEMRTRAVIQVPYLDFDVHDLAGPDGDQPLPVRDRGGRARGDRGLGVARFRTGQGPELHARRLARSSWGDRGGSLGRYEAWVAGSSSTSARRLRS